jgi:signal transduction histidine kinase
MVEATSGTTGQAFFEALVQNLTRALGVRHALVGELTGPQQKSSRTLAVAWNGELGTPFTYELAGTPCETVLTTGQIAYYPTGVAALFPRDAALQRLGVEAYMGTPLRGADGEYLGLLVVLHDRPLDEAREPANVLRIFAARAAAELARTRDAEQIREAEERLRFALAAATMATFDHDLGTGTTHWSRGAEQVLGHPLVRLSCRPEGLGAVVHDEDRERLLRCLAAMNESAEATLDLRVRIDSPSGQPRWIHLRGRAESTTRGGTRRIAGVAADVTDHEVLQRTLVEVQRREALGQLATHLVHDINNVLSIVAGSAELIRELGPDAETQEHLAAIDAAIDRSQLLTRRLLGIARNDTEAAERIRPGAILEGLRPVLVHVLRARVTVRVENTAPTATVRMAAPALEQVLLNLAINARDAMPRGGTLTLRCAPLDIERHQRAAQRGFPGRQPGVLLSVTDTGEGMDSELTEAVFAPYFSTKDRNQGSGVGLTSCRSLVERAGGRIWIESHRGAGTEVLVVLPQECDPPSP